MNTTFKFALKGVFPVENGKKQISPFYLKMKILNFCTKSIRMPLVENGKSEHRNWILHIGIISLLTQFQLNLKIFIFWAKFAQKGYFRPIGEKLHFCVNSWLLLTAWNFFPESGRQTQRHFSVSSPPNRRNRKLFLTILYKIC